MSKKEVIRPSTHTISVTRHMGDPDLGAEETVDITFTYLNGAPERGPSYASGGQPADPDEVEFVSARPEFPDTGDHADIVARDLTDWARDWIEGGENDTAIFTQVRKDGA